MKQDEHDEQGFEQQVRVVDHHGMLNELLFEFTKHEVDLVKDAVHLDKPEQFERVDHGLLLKCDQPGHAGEEIEDEGLHHVRLGDLGQTDQLFLARREELQHDVT